MTGRLIIHDPATGERRVIDSHEAALVAFLAASKGRTLCVGRLSAVPEERPTDG